MICFGLSEHTLEEELPKFSEKARDEIETLRSWFDESKIDEHIIRPYTTSNWNPNVEENRSQARQILGLLLIRELPIKNFYVRSTIMYFYVTWFIMRMLGKGWLNSRPVLFYNYNQSFKSLMNYPEVFWWNMVRVLPKIPNVPDASTDWKWN